MDEDLDVPDDVRRDLREAATQTKLSYGWLCSIYRRGAATARVIGPTGRFPFGRLGPHDDGEIAIAIAADLSQGVVRFEFGAAVTHLALPAGRARELAVLLARAADLDRRLQ